MAQDKDDSPNPPNSGIKDRSGVSFYFNKINVIVKRSHMKQASKTTKQLLEDALKDQKRTPLYNPRAIDELKQAFNRWQQSSMQPALSRKWFWDPRHRGVCYTRR